MDKKIKDKFRVYAYTAPGSIGICRHDDSVMKDFVDAGFNCYLLTGLNQFNGGDYQNSDAKKTIELAKKHGINEFIMRDGRLIDLIFLKDKLLGENDCKFKTEDQLDEYVLTCLNDYLSDVIGVDLRDEPKYYETDSFCTVYRSIRRVTDKLGLEDFYIHINLLPINYERLITVNPDKSRTYINSNVFVPDKEYESINQAFRTYIARYLDGCKANRLCVDDYPFRRGRFLSTYFTSLQILAEECRKRDVEFSFILQAYDTKNCIFREVDKFNMYLQMNAVVGFGAKDIGFYTYMAHGGSDDKYVAKSSFVRANGEKNPTYYNGKKVIKEFQDFAKVIQPFNYKGAKFFYNTDFYYLSITENFDNSYEFKYLKNLSVDNDLILTTEMAKDNSQYLYMISNAADTVYNLGEVNFTAEFDGEFTHVEEYYFGTKEECGYKGKKELKDGKYTKTLASGAAVYLIPTK